MFLLYRAVLNLLRGFMVLALAAMVVLVFGNVVLRFGFNSGISISDEMSRYLFVWLIFAGAVVAMHDHAHLGVESLTSRLGPAARRVCAVAADLLMLFCCVLLFIGGYKQTMFNMENLAPVSGLPIGLVYAASLVASVGLFVIIALHLLHTLGWVSGDWVVETAQDPEVDAEKENLPRQGNAS